MRDFEVLIIEAVLQEVDQVRYDSLCALCLQQVYQMVVRCREEFYKDLSDDADSWLFDIQCLDIVKVMDDITAELFELPA